MKTRSAVGGGIWAALILAWSTGAAAQEASDLNPPPPAATGGAWAPGWYPGMPAPAPPSSASTPAAAASKAAAGAAANNSGRGEAVYSAVELGTEIADGPVDGSGIPETHRVRKGDTLWGLSSSYYSSPWYWPRLWSYNPLITNPHWIYPGDVVRLRTASTAAAATSAQAPAPATSSAPGIQRRSIERNIGLRQTGFVDQGDLKISAEIMGSREEKSMLATLDEAYLEFKRDQPLVPGERYSVYRVVSAVKRPGTGRVIGSIVEVVGEVEVRSINEKLIAKAVITEALNPIERHFRVGPLRRRFALVEPVAATVNLDVFVAATLRPTELVGEATFVFLDRGQDDGLALGNRLPVVRRGDGTAPLLTLTPTDDPRFPREVVGELLVIEVRGKTSTAVVSHAVKEIAVGDRVQARKGY